MNLREQSHPAELIARDAMTATEDTYEEKVSECRRQNFTYLPLPEEEKFYNTKEGYLNPIDEEQWIEAETHLLEVMDRLQRSPFLLYENPDGKYWFIDLADLNKRPTREMLYPLFARLAELIARRIQDHHDDSEELLSHFPDETLQASTIGNWYQDRHEDAELHITEYMNLSEMRDVLSNASPKLYERACGFRNQDEIDELSSIAELRNKIMHANRSLVRSREDIDEILSKVDRTETFINRAMGKA